jgi:hypothetical protein
MSYDMTQMVIALSNWSSPNFDWFQHNICQGQCSKTSTWSSMSNLEFRTTEVEPIDPPSPKPDPDDGDNDGSTEYEYGNDCTNLTDQDCAKVDCAKCSWSWPKYDPLSFESLDAMCRCEYYEGETIPVFSYPELLVDVDGV